MKKYTGEQRRARRAQRKATLVAKNKLTRSERIAQKKNLKSIQSKLNTGIRATRRLHRDAARKAAKKPDDGLVVAVNALEFEAVQAGRKAARAAHRGLKKLAAIAREQRIREYLKHYDETVGYIARARRRLGIVVAPQATIPAEAVTNEAR